LIEQETTEDTWVIFCYLLQNMQTWANIVLQTTSESFNFVGFLVNYAVTTKTWSLEIMG